MKFPLPTLTLRQRLDIIDAMLADGTKTANDLWMVLSGAVRGPDTVLAHKIKDDTTAPLRTAAFPVTAKLYNSGSAAKLDHPSFGHGDKLFNVEMAQGGGNHFHYHAVEAAARLGLLKDTAPVGATFDDPAAKW